ncbi:MAG: IS66 family insertion sequence element accessory protein TnpB [Gammaproteobacteria bacterium]
MNSRSSSFPEKVGISEKSTYRAANGRATWLKALVHVGFSLWLYAWRLHQGKFLSAAPGTSLSLPQAQPQALVLGLPWHRLRDVASIRVA